MKKGGWTGHRVLAVAVMVALLGATAPTASLGNVEVPEVVALDTQTMGAPAVDLGLPGPKGAGGFDCEADDPVPPLLQQAGLVEYSEDPTGGTWQTWFVDPADIVVTAPPAVASAETAEELLELHQMALELTDEQILAAQSWDDGGATKAWTELYMSLIVEHAAKAGKRNPPRLSREMAMHQTAMYDALVVTWAAKYCYLRPAPSELDPALQPLVAVRPMPSYPSEHAAVAGVNSVMLRYFFPEDEEPPGSLEALALQAAESRLWAGTNYRSDIEAGLAIGMAVAQAVIDARANDGANAPSTRTPVTGTCNWVPTPPAFRPTPLEPQWGDVTPFAMASGSQFRAPPPPACDGPEYIGQTRDLYEMSITITDRQAEVSDFWEAGQGTVTPPGMSLLIALDKSQEYGLTTLRLSRVMSYVGVAVADAAIACWDTKFTYWYDRPVTTIRRLGWDPTWLPRAGTPPFPGYVSGHSTFTGAGMQTLKYFFPDDEPEFRAYSSEAALARFYGGIHIRADNDQGIEIGLQIGGLLNARAASDGADL